MILLVPIRFIESLFTDKKLKIKNHYDEEAAAILHQQEESGPMPGAPLNTNTQPNNYPNGYNNIPPQNNYPPYNGYPQNKNTNYNQTNQNYNNNYSQNNYPNYPGQDNNGRGGNR